MTVAEVKWRPSSHVDFYSIPLGQQRDATSDEAGATLGEIGPNITMATCTAIPLSALFPPSDTSPPAYFPSPSFALLGPLPPTTPIHLSLNFLALSQLPDYIDAPTKPVEGGASAASIGDKERALIITGPKTTWTENVMEEDEPWLRTHGSEYTALSWLRRVDVR